MRFFIALEIPDQSRQELQVVQEEIGRFIPEARLIQDNKFHLTLAFLGEQPEDMKEMLIDCMTQAVKDVPPFSVTPAYIDGFPNLHNARVLWAGVKGDIDKLMVIRERIKDGLIDLNLSVDHRRYEPHITLAKINSNWELKDSQEVQLQSMMMRDFAPINITAIKLFESIPNEGFHKHNTLAEIKLG